MFYLELIYPVEKYSRSAVSIGNNISKRNYEITVVQEIHISR